MLNWVKRSFNTASAWVSAFAANASGVYNIVKFARTFFNVENGSTAEVAVTATSAAVSVIPCIMQAKSYNEMMAKLHHTDPCCNSCGAISCCCQNTISKIYAAVVKTVHSGASLSLILTRLIGLPAGFVLTGLLSIAYVVSQYFVANYGNKKKAADLTDEEQAQYSTVMSMLLKILAAAGCVSGVATSVLGISTIIEMLSEKKITVSPDHATTRVLLIDLYALIAALIPMILQGKAYYVLAKDALEQPKVDLAPSSLNQVLTCILRLGAVYSALYKSLGSQTGPVTLCNLLLDEVLELGIWPSVGIGIALFAIMSWQQYGYINAEQVRNTRIDVVTAMNTDTELADDSFNEARPSFWQRITPCCSKSKEQLDEEQYLLLTSNKF